MGMIHCDELGAGMVLAADVRDASGRLLLPKGNVLADKHLRIFRAWGVTEADIEGAERDELCATAVAALAPEILAQAEAVVAEQFAVATIDHPLVVELRRVAVLRTARKLAEVGS